MKVLLDSNILAWLAQHAHPMHAAARGAVSALQHSGETLHIVPQNLYEFWVVATRPIEVNGLGFTVAEATAELARLQALFPLLSNGPSIYPEWERLVVLHSVTGLPAYDTRLVAAMAVHGLTHLLTSNLADFSRYSSITVLDPAAVR
jgi:predicted nucleic acid-binding protein